jgi:hypothetical protein
MTALIQKRLALKLKLHKIDNCSIVSPILLNEILTKNGYNTEIVQGYCSLKNETCWHLWVESATSEQFDISYTTACLHDKQFENCRMFLHRNTVNPAKSDQEILDNWELYQKDHMAFWKKQSVKVQSVRAKLMNEKWIK